MKEENIIQYLIFTSNQKSACLEVSNCKSSIIYNGIRFYCEKPFVDKLSVTKLNDNKVLPNNEYIVDNLSSVFLSTTVRHRKCAYFRSIDLYCVIISLAMQSPIFMEFYKIQGIGKILFSIQDQDPFPTSLKSQQQIVHENMGSINIAFEILNKKQLKCGAIELCIAKCIEIFNESTSTSNS